MRYPQKHSLEDKRFSPEENLALNFDTGLSIEDPIQRHLTEVALLGWEVASLEHPDGQLTVQSAKVVLVRTLAILQAVNEKITEYINSCYMYMYGR